LTKAKILALSRKEIRAQHLSYRTEKAYLDWIYRFFSFHGKKEPVELNEQDISTFLSFHAVNKQVSASTQNQARYALQFLYRNVLKREVDRIKFIRVEPSVSLPEVLTQEEVRAILGRLKGEKWLMAALLYGCGLSLNECLSLRIRDIDMEKEEIIIHSGIEHESRRMAIPRVLKEPMRKRLEALKYRYLTLYLKNYCGVVVPYPVEKKDPEASRSFQWFFIFPSLEPVKDRRTGKTRIHHRSDSYIQKAVRKSLGASGIDKQASCQNFRHSYAVHLLEEGYDIRVIQHLLGHKNIRSTMIYKQVMNRNRIVPKSPLDLLLSRP
jgi:integron integrase